jgi:uncharacterized protein
LLLECVDDSRHRVQNAAEKTNGKAGGLRLIMISKDQLSIEAAARGKWEWLRQIGCVSAEIPDPLAEGLVDGVPYFYNPLGHRGVVVLRGDSLRLMRLLQSGMKLDAGAEECEFHREDATRFFKVLYALADCELVQLSDGFSKLLEEQHRLRRQKVETFYVWLQLTDRCNLACGYCFVDKRSGSMPIDLAKEIVKKIVADAGDAGFGRVVFKLAGGEPMLQYRSVKELIDWSGAMPNPKGIALRFALLTNGTFMPAEILDMAVSGRLGISLSLDGVDKWHDSARRYKKDGRGSFADIDKTISLLVERNVKPYILVTVGVDNVGGLQEIAEYCFERGLRFRFNVRRLDRAVGGGTEDANKEIASGLRLCYEWMASNPPRESLYACHKFSNIHLLQPKRRVCGVGANTAMVSTVGGVSLCPQYDPVPIARFDSGNVVRMVTGQSRFEAKDINGAGDPACRGCVWRFTCGGGCPLHAFAHNGAGSRRSPHCNIFREVLPCFVKAHAKQLIVGK